MTKRSKWMFGIVAAMLIYKAFMIYIDWVDLSCYITKGAQSIEIIKQFLGFRIVWFDLITLIVLLTVLVGQGTVLCPKVTGNQTIRKRKVK